MTCFEWTLLLLAVFQWESGGDLNAWNRRENAKGGWQVRQAVITDVNRYYGTHYRLSDMQGTTQGEQVFVLYGKMWGAKTPEQFYRIWNGGPKGMQKTATLVNWWGVQKELLALQEKYDARPQNDRYVQGRVDVSVHGRLAGLSTPTGRRTSTD